MYTSRALLDVHERAHRNLAGLIAHCVELGEAAVRRELEGFGVPTIREQLFHQIGAERYWIGVLRDRMDVDDPDEEYPTTASLEDYRSRVFMDTREYLRGASSEELNTPRTMMTWGNNERVLIPAHVVMRAATHLYHHQGQILAMCRLLGKPRSGLDFPLQ